MITDPSLPIQKALVAALKDLNTVADDNVFDQVPTSNPFPRITVGGAEVNPVMADCYDGSESFVQIDAWSRAVGFPQVKAIAGAIRERFHQGALTVEGHTVELMFVEQTIYERDPDGLTNRARMIVRIQSQPSD